MLKVLQGFNKGVQGKTVDLSKTYINVVVWAHVAARQRKALVFSRLLCVAGRVERQGELVQLIAGKQIDRTAMLALLAPRHLETRWKMPGKQGLNNNTSTGAASRQ